MTNKKLFNKILNSEHTFSAMSLSFQGLPLSESERRALYEKYKTAAYAPQTPSDIDECRKKLQEPGVINCFFSELDPVVTLGFPTGTLPTNWTPTVPTIEVIKLGCGGVFEFPSPVPTGIQNNFDEDFPDFPLPQPPHVPPTPRIPTPTIPRNPKPPQNPGPPQFKPVPPQAPDPSLPPNKPPGPPPQADPPTDTFVPPPKVPPDPPPTGAINTNPISLTTDFYQIIDGGITGTGAANKMWNGWIKAGTYSYDSPGLIKKFPPAFIRNLEKGRCVAGLGALNDIDPFYKKQTKSFPENSYFSQNPNMYKTNRGNTFYYKDSPLADNDFFDGYTCTGLGTPNSILQVNWLPLSRLDQTWSILVHRTLFSSDHRAVAHKELLVHPSRSELTWGPAQPQIRVTGNLIVRVERATDNQTIVVATRIAPPNKFNMPITTDSDQVKHGFKYYSKSIGITYTSAEPLDGGEWASYPLLEFPYVFSAMVTPIAIENLTIKITPAFTA